MTTRDPIETPGLRTPRLVLRAATVADVPQLLPLSVYDGRRAADEAEAELMLRRIADDQAAGATVHWAMALPNREREIVGTCGFYRGFVERQGEIGYVLKEQFRGRGFMTEAVRAIVAWGFGVFGLERIVAHTDSANVRSRAVLERVGFTLASSDAAQLSYRLTRDDWLANG